MQNPLHRVKLSGRMPGASSDASAEPRRSPANAGRRRVIGVLGFGVDGRCVAEFLQQQPEVREVRVFDDNAKIGSSLDGVGLLFRSPGFKLTHPLVLEARKKGIPITSSTIYFLQHFQGITVGITGSNGKTTCTALIAAMLRAEFGKEGVEEGGNDRKPRLDLLNHQSPITNHQLIFNSQFSIPNYVVLELSSFQLIDCPVSPHVAVVLNVTPNHLDWHASMEEYIEAKRQIVANQRGGEGGEDERMKGDVAVLNPHDPIVKNFVKGLKSTVRWFEDPPSCTVRCRTHPDTIRAAVTTARALDVSDTNIVKVLENFPGVPHRLEFVRELNGSKWYNDSSCTTPESAITTCEAFPVGTVVLLLGGRDKGMDFSKLYDVIEKRDVRVVPYGEMATTFEQHIPKSYKLKAKSSFVEVITTARSVGRSNVVLSPACASFDMFANAKERGELFATLVRAL